LNDGTCDYPSVIVVTWFGGSLNDPRKAESTCLYPYTVLLLWHRGAKERVTGLSSLGLFPARSFPLLFFARPYFPRHLLLNKVRLGRVALLCSEHPRASPLNYFKRTRKSVRGKNRREKDRRRKDRRGKDQRGTDRREKDRRGKYLASN